MPLEFLVGVADQADVDELGPAGMLCTFAAHVDNAVAERTPFLAYDGDAAILECLQLTVTARHDLAGDAGEQAAAVHADAGLDGLDDRDDTGVIARMCDDDIKLGDMVVLAHQIIDGRLLVDGQDAVFERIGIAQLHVLHVHVSDSQLHAHSLLSFSFQLEKSFTYRVSLIAIIFTTIAIINLSH